MIHDFDSVFHPMAGVFPMETKMMKKRARLGYREAILKQDSILGSNGDVVRGHEFHYSEIVNSAGGQKCGSEEVISGLASLRNCARIYSVKDGAGNSLPDEGYQFKNTLGSYIHIHFGSNGMIAEKFISFIKEHYGDHSSCRARQSQGRRQ